jgi:hypothetical protein
MMAESREGWPEACASWRRKCQELDKRIAELEAELAGALKQRDQCIIEYGLWKQYAVFLMATLVLDVRGMARPLGGVMPGKDVMPPPDDMPDLTEAEKAELTKKLSTELDEARRYVSCAPRLGWIMDQC